MSGRGRYITIASLSLIGLSAFILFGPGPAKNQNETNLWDKSWDMIEYFPAAGDVKNVQAGRTDAGSAARKFAGRDRLKKPEKPDKSKKRGTPDRHKHGKSKTGVPRKPPEDPFAGQLRLTFIRTGGLFRDSYFVITPAGGKPGRPIVKRRGSNVIKNIFTEWGKPRIQAIYRTANGAIVLDKKNSLALAKLGISPGSAKLYLYENKAPPVILTLGTKTKNGRLFFTSNLPEHAGRVFTMQAYPIDKFKLAYNKFRERNILYYPPQAYTAELTLNDGRGKTLRLRQRKGEKNGRPNFEWTDDRGEVLPAHLTTSLDNYCKQVRVQYFSDEDAVSGLGDAERLWKASRANILTIQVHVKDGPNYTLRLRPSSERELKPADKQLVLLRSSLDEPHVDYVERQIMDSITRQITRISIFRNRPRTGRIQRKQMRPPVQRSIKPPLKGIPKPKGKPKGKVKPKGRR